MLSSLICLGSLIGGEESPVIAEQDSLILSGVPGVPGIIGFTSNQEWLIVAEGRAIRIWSSNAWREVKVLHEESVIADCVLLPDSDQMLVETIDTDGDSVLEVKRISNGELETGLGPGPWGALAVSADGASVILLTRDSRKVRGSEPQFCEVVDRQSGKSRLRVAAPELDRFTAAAFSPSGDKILLGTWRGRLLLYSTQGRLLREFAVSPEGQAHRGAVASVRFFHRLPLVLSGDGRSEPVVRVWDIETGTQVTELRLSDDENDQIQGVAIAGDERILAVASMRKFALYSATTWDELWSLRKEAGEGGFNSPAFAPNGEAVLVVDYPHRTKQGPSSVRIFSIPEVLPE